MWKYYKQTLSSGDITVLVRLSDNLLEHYDGKGIWTNNWPASGYVYMHLVGKARHRHLYREVGVEEVEEIKRQIDKRYKKWRMFAYKNDDPV